MLLKQKQNKTISPLFTKQYEEVASGCFHVYRPVLWLSRVRITLLFGLIGWVRVGSVHSRLWPPWAPMGFHGPHCLVSPPPPTRCTAWASEQFLTAWSLPLTQGRWHPNSCWWEGLIITFYYSKTRPLPPSATWNPHSGCDSSLSLANCRDVSEKWFYICPVPSSSSSFSLPLRKSPDSRLKRNSAVNAGLWWTCRP